MMKYSFTNISHHDMMNLGRGDKLLLNIGDFYIDKKRPGIREKIKKGNGG